MLLLGLESWRTFIKNTLCIRFSRGLSTCIRVNWSIVTWSHQTSCWILTVWPSWLILDLPGQWLRSTSRSQNQLWQNTWPRDGTERLKFCLDLRSTPRPWTCGRWDVFWANCIMERRFFQEILHWTNSKESLSFWENQPAKKWTQWSQWWQKSAWTRWTSWKRNPSAAFSRTWTNSQWTSCANS